MPAHSKEEYKQELPVAMSDASNIGFRSDVEIGNSIGGPDTNPYNQGQSKQSSYKNLPNAS